MFNDQLDDAIINEATISKFQLIASGHTIDLSEDEIFEMKLISILVDNEELFCKLNEISINDINESNINQLITNLAIFFQNFTFIFSIIQTQLILLQGTFMLLMKKTEKTSKAYFYIQLFVIKILKLKVKIRFLN